MFEWLTKRTKAYKEIQELVYAQSVEIDKQRANVAKRDELIRTTQKTLEDATIRWTDELQFSREAQRRHEEEVRLYKQSLAQSTQETAKLRAEFSQQIIAAYAIGAEEILRRHNEAECVIAIKVADSMYLAHTPSGEKIYDKYGEAIRSAISVNPSKQRRVIKSDKQRIRIKTEHLDDYISVSIAHANPSEITTREKISRTYSRAREILGEIKEYLQRVKQTHHPALVHHFTRYGEGIVTSPKPSK